MEEMYILYGKTKGKYFSREVLIEEKTLRMKRS
jgi:hypothetical protein